MKLLRYGPKGQEKPGLMDATGTIRDLSGHITDITPQTLTPEGLAAIAKIDQNLRSGYLRVLRFRRI